MTNEFAGSSLSNVRIYRFDLFDIIVALIYFGFELHNFKNLKNRLSQKIIKRGFDDENNSVVYRYMSLQLEVLSSNPFLIAGLMFIFPSLLSFLGSLPL